jgi:hypothetical protein
MDYFRYSFNIRSDGGRVCVQPKTVDKFLEVMRYLKNKTIVSDAVWLAFCFD